MNRKSSKTLRRRAKRRLKRKGNRVSREAYKTRKPQRGQAGNGEPRRWLQRQLKA